MFVLVFFKTLFNKTIIRFGFCDILNNYGLSNSYWPLPWAGLITLTLNLFSSDITKVESNKCLFVRTVAHASLESIIFLDKKLNGLALSRRFVEQKFQETKKCLSEREQSVCST